MTELLLHLEEDLDLELGLGMGCAGGGKESAPPSALETGLLRNARKGLQTAAAAADSAVGVATTTTGLVPARGFMRGGIDRSCRELRISHCRVLGRCYQAHRQDKLLHVFLLPRNPESILARK